MRRLTKRILSYVPTSLPVGMTEFLGWADDIIELIGPGFEQVSKDEFLFVLATSITHMGPQASRKSKQHFIRTLRAAAAKQIAGGVFQDVKKRQEAARQAAQLKQAEETAAKEAVNGNPTQETP